MHVHYITPLQCVTRYALNNEENAHDDQNEWSVGWSGCGWKYERVGVVDEIVHVGMNL